MNQSRKITRLAFKEWRLLMRNPHGLAVLFFMPAVFVLVMSFSLKTTLDAGVSMPRTGWVLEDSGPTARRWANEFQRQFPGRTLATRDALLVALKAREIDVGIIIRRPWLDAELRPQATQLEMWLSHRVQPAAAARLRAELGFSTLRARVAISAAQAGPFAAAALNSFTEPDSLAVSGSPSVRYLYEVESGRKITPVQQSVPAWLVFGMFFVVIPISGVLIQERNDGTLTRLKIFGVSKASFLGGKFFAFLFLNLLQLAFMLFVGRWLVPWLGGDALDLSVSIGWFMIVAIATSVAAVCLALLISSLARQFEHAAALGGGINIILGAIAGIMVPRVLMPPGLQIVSEWSPMGWALDAMQVIFLGVPDSGFILARVGLLIVFGLLCLLLSLYLLARHEASA